jgi:NADPH2:quinone reductase
MGNFFAELKRLRGSKLDAGKLSMRAMIFDHYGNPDVMHLRDAPIPEPQDDEVLIRVSCAGVNPADSKIRAGDAARAGYPSALPSVPGMDGAGVVERTGRNVTEFHTGDSVIFWSAPAEKTWGSYAEFASVSTRCAFRMPESLNFAQAASVPIAAITAFQSLFHSEIVGMTPGQKVLINGAAGGVGSFAVQFAKVGGLLVAATSRTANIGYVRSLGADRVIDYKTEDVGRALRHWSPEGVDLVLDIVGPATLPQALDMLRPDGRLVSIFTLTADGEIERDTKEAARRGFRKFVSIVNLERAPETIRRITHLIDRGVVRVPPIDVLPLEEAARAHKMIDTGHVRGKLVLKVAELST